MRFTLESWLRLEKIGTKTKRRKRRKKKIGEKKKIRLGTKMVRILEKKIEKGKEKKNKKREREHIRFGPFEGLYRTSGNSMIRLRSKTMTLDLNALAHIPPEIGQESAMEVHGKAA